MKRVMFFIDGFNLYHAIKDMAEGFHVGKYYNRPKQIFNRYKWLDLDKLTSNYIDNRNEESVGIKYFTSFAQWKVEGLSRHKIYISALYAIVKNIEVIYGKFKKIERRCKICNQYFKTHIEKMTDVNLSIYLFENAYLDKFDKAIVISGDSDLIPSILAILRNFPQKEIEIVIPIGRQGIELLKSTPSHRRMKEKHLKNSQLPDDISSGAIKRPIEWSLVSRLLDGNLIWFNKNIWKIFDGSQWNIEKKPDPSLIENAKPLTDMEILDLAANKVFHL
ncbi:MAG: NYN domain-containing protein [Endomicrobiales bacterium]|nr:NYN domain-containing protein [Endomicrobiales bacterium]